MGVIPLFAPTLLGPSLGWVDSVPETQILSSLTCFAFSFNHLKNKTKPLSRLLFNEDGIKNLGCKLIIPGGGLL